MPVIRGVAGRVVVIRYTFWVQGVAVVHNQALCSKSVAVRSGICLEMARVEYDTICAHVRFLPTWEGSDVCSDRVALLASVVAAGMVTVSVYTLWRHV